MFVGCAPVRLDIAFYLVRDQYITPDDIINQVNFAKAIVNASTVGSTQTRFACYVYGSIATRQEIFDFQSKFTKDGVLDALDGIPGTIAGSGQLETIENLKFIWDTIFYTGKGDRHLSDDICFTMISGENNSTFTKIGGLLPGTIDWRIIDAQVNYPNNKYYTDSTYHYMTSSYREISSFSNASFLTTEVELFTSAAFPCDYCKYFFVNTVVRNILVY